MSAAKHAPGPWQWDGAVWDYDPESEAPWLLDAADKRVLWGGIRCDSEANARLIAAAPDLLRIAKLLVDWLDEEEGAHKLCDAARAAIAKATGSAT